MPLLALVPIKDWIYCGLLVAVIAGGFWYHHKLIGEGIAEQRLADDRASATLAANTAKQTAELQVRATTAEQAYDKERADTQNYRDSHPLQPVRLCVDSHNRGSIVPKAGAANSGDAGTSTAAKDLHDVPSGDNSGREGAAGPDISGMLELLASKADDVSAVLREFKSR